MKIIGKFKGKLICKCSSGFYHKTLLLSSGCLICEHEKSSTWYDYLDVNSLEEITNENIISKLNNY